MRVARLAKTFQHLKTLACQVSTGLARNSPSDNLSLYDFMRPNSQPTFIENTSESAENIPYLQEKHSLGRGRKGT